MRAVSQRVSTFCPWRVCVCVVVLALVGRRRASSREWEALSFFFHTRIRLFQFQFSTRCAAALRCAALRPIVRRYQWIPASQFKRRAQTEKNSKPAQKSKNNTASDAARRHHKEKHALRVYFSVERTLLSSCSAPPQHVFTTDARLIPSSAPS